MLRALDDRPVVHAVQAARPDQRQVAPALVRVGDAPGVGGGHHHVAGGQPLRGLRAGFPPLHEWLDLVQFGEGAILAGLGRQRLVHVLGLDAIGHQGEFQVVHRTLAQAALAGEFLQVPEVRPGGRRNLQLVGVIGDRHAPDQRRRAAFLGRVGDQLLVAADGIPVQALEQALVTAAGQVGPLDLHHVPVGMAGIGHHLDLGHLAVVLALHQFDPGAGRERFEEGLFLRLLPGAAVADHHHAFRRLGDTDTEPKGQQQGLQSVFPRNHRALPPQDRCRAPCRAMAERTVKWRVHRANRQRNTAAGTAGPLQGIHAHLRCCCCGARR
ncbi:hypothetical protein D3C81_992230 [compost metagenome]